MDRGMGLRGAGCLGTGVPGIAVPGIGRRDLEGSRFHPAPESAATVVPAAAAVPTRPTGPRKFAVAKWVPVARNRKALPPAKPTAAPVTASGRAYPHWPGRRRPARCPAAPARAHRAPAPVLTLIPPPIAVRLPRGARKKAGSGRAAHEPKTIVPSPDGLVPRHAGGRSTGQTHPDKGIYSYEGTHSGGR